MDKFSNRFLNWLTRWGVVPFGLLIACILIIVVIGVTVLFQEAISVDPEWVDYARPFAIALLIAPWLTLFFVHLIKQLGDSRLELTRTHKQQRKLNQQLHNKVEELNREIEERQKAEDAKQQAIRYLQREITERRGTQRQLKEQAALMTSLVDSSPDVIFYRNKEGIFSGCNTAFEELLNKSEDELIGMSVDDVYSKDDAARIREVDCSVVETQQPIIYEQWMNHPDGRKVLYEFKKVPFFNYRGELFGLLAFGRDITERKQASDALEKAAREKTTFISTISHELRTPLNGIVGLSQMLRDTKLNEEQLSFVNTIYLSAVALGNIFNDIIDMDKLDRHSLSVVKEAVGLPELVDDLSAIAVLMCQQKQLEFNYICQDPLPELIESDATRLRQVLWNLLHNAVKYTEKGEVTLKVEAEQLNDQRANLTFTVCDSGIGIAPAEQDKIFAMYYQVPEVKRQGLGTGIGLAVSQQLVRAMQGDIKVSSEVNVGSCFEVSMAVQCLDKAHQADELVESVTLPPIKALLVEDIELNVMVAKSVLEKLGVEVVVAMTGQEALDAAEQHDFDLFLLDIQLPDMSGFDVAEHLMNDERTELVPRFAFTANVVKDKSEYLNKGMDEVLTKPINMTHLRKTLYEYFAVVPIEGTQAPTPHPDYEQCLDVEVLTQFIEAIGKEFTLKSVDMFEQTMPEYMAVLDSNMLADDLAEVASVAHKVKGAAGSVGLKRISQLAALAQDRSQPAWKDNLNDWLDQIREFYPKDIALLKEWIQQH